MKKQITDQEISIKISNLINGVSTDFGRQARLEVEKAIGRGGTRDQVYSEVERILDDFAARASTERERLLADRRRQEEADRQAALERGRELAFASAFERPRSTREIVELCDQAGLTLDLLEGDRIAVSGGSLSLFLDLLIKMNRERIVEFLKTHRTVTAII